MKNIKKKIFIVEDEQLIIKAYSDYLMGKGYEVAVALHGKEALQRIPAFRPDLILLDIIMPDIDGLAILKKLKSDSETKGIPVVILTNLQTNNAVATAMSLGSHSYLLKVDYDLEKLKKKIEEILNKDCCRE